MKFLEIYLASVINKIVIMYITFSLMFRLVYYLALSVNNYT